VPQEIRAILLRQQLLLQLCAEEMTHGMCAETFFGDFGRREDRQAVSDAGRHCFGTMTLPALAKYAADPLSTAMSFFQRLTYPETEIRRRIKSRLPRISLHETSELDENPEMGGRTVYTFAAPDRSDEQ
jgi:hypothetical protein